MNDEYDRLRRSSFIPHRFFPFSRRERQERAVVVGSRLCCKSRCKAEQILDQMPDLEREDLRASLYFAARRIDRSILRAAF